MAPLTRSSPVRPVELEESCEMPALEQGDRLDQKTFHERYEAMPEHTKAELIGGIVHMPSPLKPRHGRMHTHVMGWLHDYEVGTGNVEAYDNTTAILGEESEPQPDGYLIVSPDGGGQMRYNDEEYLVGAPELVAEIASSRESIDLHAKREDYQRAGVKEYIVVALRQENVFWFVLRDGGYQEAHPGADGLLRSEVFPGLWIDPAALLRLDGKRLKEVLQQGLATPEHAAFVTRLAEAKAKGTSS